MSNEADTCRKYVVPLLQAAGWDDELSDEYTVLLERIWPATEGFSVSLNKLRVTNTD